MHSLLITKLIDGGYIVADDAGAPIAAFTDIEVALAFIQDKLERA